MKNPARIIATGLFACTLSASAQNGVRMPDPMSTLNRSEKEMLNKQANLIFDSAKPAVATAAKSTVTISHRGERLAFGTAIHADGKLLTKWSEIAAASNRLIVTTPDGKRHAAIVTGIYKEHDLAILKCATELTPVSWAADITLDLGDFIALATPSGEVEGLGVVSVQARSLRERDKAYLGVRMDFTANGGGIPLTEVVAGSAAAKAGLKNGDVVLAIDQNEVQGAVEMRNILQRLVPGSEIRVRYRRGKTEQDTKVFLGSRADTQNIRRVPQARMSRMQRMGAEPSKVRDNFPIVIQSDMAIEPNDAGAPVVDLDGNIIGISIARGSRIKTFIIPSHAIRKVLTTKPTPYTSALAREVAADEKPDRSQTRRNRPRSGRNNTEVEENPIGKVRKHLDNIGRNNQSTEDNLKKIEEALRNMEKGR